MKLRFTHSPASLRQSACVLSRPPSSEKAGTVWHGPRVGRADDVSERHVCEGRWKRLLWNLSRRDLTDLSGPRRPLGRGLEDWPSVGSHLWMRQPLSTLAAFHRLRRDGWWGLD